MPDLINSQEPITIDFLRKCFHENDFLTIPVIDLLEYDETELKLYNRILTIVNTEWKTISKELGLNHPQSCYSNDYSTELLRERVQKIIADIVIKLVRNDKALENVTDTFVIPIIQNDETGDEQLHNTVSVTGSIVICFSTMMKFVLLELITVKPRATVFAVFLSAAI